MTCRLAARVSISAPIPVLRPMPDTEDFNARSGNPIDDHVGPDHRQFPRPGNQARPAALGQIFEPVTSRDELHRDACGCVRVLVADVLADMGEVIECLGREDYRHSGLGNSFSVPQESSHFRTSS